MHQRRETPELGWGECTLLENEPPALFAHRSDWQGSTVVAVHNLAGHDVKTTLPIEEDGTLVDLLGAEDLEPPFELALEPYGYRWYRVGGLEYALRRRARN
jgi:maltose alpha-D-glucosyltransferase/alpha-amylase